LFTSALLSGCGTTPRTNKLETPVFSSLDIPSGSGWSSYSPTSPPAEILPTKGRAVRVWLYAPLGSVFNVSLRELDSTVTGLRENRGATEPPEAGFFQVVSINTALNPPLYTLYVRAPMSLTDPANYDILVVNESLRTDVANSDAMALPLRQRKVFNVSVQITGNGYVTSNPAGIQCGVSRLGTALINCSYDFGPGTVTLNPASNDLTTTKLLGWTGNCAADVQVCTLTLTGAAALNATANFGPSNAVVTPSQCSTTPLIAGLRWIDLPACATGVRDSHPGISNPALCDAQGYFCCEPGPQSSNAPRCGGAGQIESAPDCRHHPGRGMLRQPGGCYEVNSGP
jgi:hypothetical protein